MDVLRFVNSKDIRKYLKEIKYEFSSQEAAWLIWQCRSITIQEKYTAWNELIATMPDCKIKERRATIPQDSLHKFLKQYMEERNYDVFEGLWFEFPTPFKKGDILWKPKYPTLNYTCGPFVTNGVCLDGIDGDKLKDNIRLDGDISNMSAGGYFINDSGNIYLECISNYMDLEFYKEKLAGPQNTLFLLSNFLKGKTSLEKFVQEYQHIITASNTNRLLPEIIEVILEYIEFCKNVSPQEAIKYIYENICYDYDLKEDKSIYALIKLFYERKED